MVFGNEVVFKKGATHRSDGRDILANDIPFSSTCRQFSEQPVILCYADAPLIKDFDWGN